MIKFRQVSDIYDRIKNICESDGFTIEIDGKKYHKNNISYDFIVKNASHIGYIESTSIPESRIYASNFVILIIILSLDRHCISDDHIEFLELKPEVVDILYRSITWNLNSGYNSALEDAKVILDKLRESSDSLTRGI